MLSLVRCRGVVGVRQKYIFEGVSWWGSSAFVPGAVGVGIEDLAHLLRF